MRFESGASRLLHWSALPDFQNPMVQYVASQSRKKMQTTVADLSRRYRASESAVILAFACYPTVSLERNGVVRLNGHHGYRDG